MRPNNNNYLRNLILTLWVDSIRTTRSPLIATFYGARILETIRLFVRYKSVIIIVNRTRSSNPSMGHFDFNY